MLPTISILMPIYKTAPYLKEAVDSILAQTYTDFELIALNDCSPDNAEEIMDQYDDPRIVRYKGEKNEGLANILNIGMARGRFIARMDSDNISLPQRLERQMQYLEMKEVGLDLRIKPQDCIFPDSLMFNSFFHLSGDGATIRTEQLIPLTEQYL